MRRAVRWKDLPQREERGYTSSMLLVSAVREKPSGVLVCKAEIVAAESPAMVLWIEHVAERQYAPYYRIIHSERDV